MATLYPLNDAEIAWLAQLRQGLSELGIPADLKTLSDVFAAQREAWFAIPEAERGNPNPLIDGAGAVIGDLLAAELGLQWVIATDEHGTDAALHGQPGDILLYPINSVAKRWSDGGNLADFVAWTMTRVREFQAQAG